MLATALPVPPGDAGLFVNDESKLNRPNALCPGGLAVSLISRWRKSTPNFKLCDPFCQDTPPMFSMVCSRRISGSERAFPKPAYPDGLMIGAEGWNGSEFSRPGIVFQTGSVNVVGRRKFLNFVNPKRYSATTLG